MGLLDDYGVDVVSDAIETGFGDGPEPGPYRFELTDIFVKEGSVKDPEKSWVIIEYLLDDEMGGAPVEHSELFQLPLDPANPTEKERKTLGRYKTRLKNLGVPDDKINTVERDELVGLTGTLVVVENAGSGANAGRSFKNINKVKVDLPGEETAAPAAKAAPAAAAPVARQRQARATSTPNPFAPKA
jgi:hypothetical protein